MPKSVSRETITPPRLTLDFISGFIEAHGNFYWEKLKSGPSPVFRIKIHSTQYELLKLIKLRLGLNGCLRNYNHEHRKYSLLLIRGKQDIEERLIPALEGRLFGATNKTFGKWRDQIFRRKYNKHISGRDNKSIGLPRNKSAHREIVSRETI